MPYCRKCGTKLTDKQRFCHVCGTPVGQIASTYRGATTSEPQYRRPAHRAGFPVAAIAIVIIVLLIAAAFIVSFFPFQQVNFSQSNEASAPNVGMLRLVVGSEIGAVNVILRDLPGNQRAAINVSATGWRGIFGSDKPLALAFNQETTGSTLTYSVNITRAGNFAYGNLNVTCDVYVDPSVRLDIQVSTGAGTIALDADRAAVFQNVNLKVTSGTVAATLRQDTVISGAVSLDATTGTAELNWIEAQANGTVPINVVATTGSAELNITQTKQFSGNVTVDAAATTGSVNFAMNIQNDVGARISASAALGGVNVNQQGFSGNTVPIQSNNYPSRNNFDVTLTTNLGSVNINAQYQIAGTRS